MKIKIISILILIFSLSLNTLQSHDKPKIAIGNISFGPEAKAIITNTKVEAAFNLVNLIAEKYKYIDFQIQDSAIKQLKKENKAINLQNISEYLKLDKLYSIHIDVLANMLRANIMSVNLKDSSSSTGIGYAIIRYFGTKDDKALYDPGILRAMQRAFAVVERDSLMFTKNDSAFYAYPAPTLVISGIEFIDTTSLPKLDIFQMKEVNSYLIVESMFDTLKYKRNLVIYDQTTRDSIYALFRLKIPDNQTAATETELACLSRLEVEYVISGSLSRNKEGANLVLTLMKIKDNNLTLLAKKNTQIYEDSKVKLKEAAQLAVIELIKESEGKYFYKEK